MDAIKEILMREHEIVSSYHNHKETMAWTISGIYLAFTAAFMAWSRSVDWSLQCGEKWFIAGVLFMVLVCALTFMNMQFTARWNASDTADAIRRFIFPIENRLVEKVDLADLRQIYPIEIHYEMKKFGKQRNWRNFFCAMGRIVVFPIRFFSGKPSKMDARWQTEIPSYLLGVVSFAVQIFALFSWA